MGANFSRLWEFMRYLPALICRYTQLIIRVFNTKVLFIIQSEIFSYNYQETALPNYSEQCE